MDSYDIINYALYSINLTQREISYANINHYVKSYLTLSSGTLRSSLYIQWSKFALNGWDMAQCIARSTQ